MYMMYSEKYFATLLLEEWQNFSYECTFVSVKYRAHRRHISARCLQIENPTKIYKKKNYKIVYKHKLMTEIIAI